MNIFREKVFPWVQSEIRIRDFFPQHLKIQNPQNQTPTKNFLPHSKSWTSLFPCNMSAFVSRFQKLRIREFFGQQSYLVRQWALLESCFQMATVSCQLVLGRLKLRNLGETLKDWQLRKKFKSNSALRDLIEIFSSFVDRQCWCDHTLLLCHEWCFLVLFKVLTCLLISRSFGNIIHDIAGKYDHINIADLRKLEKISKKVSQSRVGFKHLTKLSILQCFS